MSLSLKKLKLFPCCKHCTGFSQDRHCPKPPTYCCAQWLPDTGELCIVTSFCSSAWNGLVRTCPAVDDSVHADREWKIDVIQASVQSPSVHQRALQARWERPSVGYWWCYIWEDGGVNESKFCKVVRALRWTGFISDPNQPLPWKGTQRLAWIFALSTAIQRPSLATRHRYIYNSSVTCLFPALLLEY